MKTMLFSSIMLSCTLVMAFTMMSENKDNKKEKKNSFECGFDQLSEKKSTFSTNFIMLMIMFLIFDVEISVLIPFIMMNKSGENYMMIMSSVFILTLMALTTKEWKQGSLEWSK